MIHTKVGKVCIEKYCQQNYLKFFDEKTTLALQSRSVIEQSRIDVPDI